MSPRSSVFRRGATALLATLLAAPSLVRAALHEQDGIYYGAWVDPAPGYSDTPWRYNARLGMNASVFQIAQLMPLPAYDYNTGAGGPAPEYLIENTSTNAAVMLTVYPTTLTGLTDNDYTVLGNQVLAYKQTYNRSVFIRWGPEMQGLWNAAYGLQPLAYVAAWRQVYTAVKQIAPDAAFVWAPNLGNGYPYGQQAPNNQTELQALDTNHDGQLDNGDDPYSPFYPGDDYVDWVGLSVYYKQDSTNVNMAQQNGFCANVYQGQGNNANGVNWYQEYCEQKPDKACMIAESGAAYHPDDNQGDASQFQIQQAWWRDCITNQQIFNQFPRIKFHMHFEYSKVESDGGIQDLRDYRLTNATDVLAAYKADLAAVSQHYIWATYVPLATAVPTTGPGISAPASSTMGPTATGPTLVMQTIRNPMITAPPSLFGTILSSAAVAKSVPYVTAVGAAVAAGVWSVVGRRP